MDQTVTQPFAANPDYYGQFCNPYCLPGHEGIDIRAPEGTPIYAVADGEVYMVQTDPSTSNYGVQVRLQHIDGYKSIYAHLSAVNVKDAQPVSAGAIIGWSGNTGNSFGAHLHLTLKRHGATAAGLTDYPYDIIDPTPYLAHIL